jgi:hypothetical protein
MKKIFLFLVIFNTVACANIFQLSTIVEEQQLIPIIKVNGDTVIKVKGVGTKQVFSSSFERSEKIFQKLNNIQNKKLNLSRIRIRRNKADYVAYVDNIELYRVTPSDIIGSNLTVYQMAKLWRENIFDALKKGPNTMVPAPIQEEAMQVLARSPLKGFFSIFSNESVFVVVIQLIMFILIQVGAIYLTFQFMKKRYKSATDEFHKRLKKLHTSQIRDRNMIGILENRIVDLNQQLDKQQPLDNLSSLES